MPPMNDSMSTKDRSENVKEDPPDYIPFSKIKSNGGALPPSPPPIPPNVPFGDIHELAPNQNGQPEPEQAIQRADVTDAQRDQSQNGEQPSALEIATNGNGQNGARSPQHQRMQDNSVDASGNESDIADQNGQEPLLQGIHASANGNESDIAHQNGQEPLLQGIHASADGNESDIANQNGQEPLLQGTHASADGNESDIAHQNGQEPLLQGIHASANDQLNGHHNDQQQQQQPSPIGINTNGNGHSSPSQHGQEEEVEVKVEEEDCMECVITDGEGPQLATGQNGLQELLQQQDLLSTGGDSAQATPIMVLPLHVMDGHHLMQLPPNCPPIANGMLMPVGSIKVLTVPSSTISLLQQGQQQLPSQTASTASSVGEFFIQGMALVQNSHPEGMEDIDTVANVQLNEGQSGQQQLQQPYTSSIANVRCIFSHQCGGQPNDSAFPCNGMPCMPCLTCWCAPNLNSLQAISQSRANSPLEMAQEEQNLEMHPMEPEQSAIINCLLCHSLQPKGLPYWSHVASHATDRCYCPVCGLLVRTFKKMEKHLIQCVRTNMTGQDWRQIRDKDLLYHAISWTTLYCHMEKRGELNVMANTTNPHGYYRFKCHYCFHKYRWQVNHPDLFEGKLPEFLESCTVMFPQYGNEVESHMEKMHKNDSFEKSAIIFSRFMFVGTIEQILKKNIVSSMWIAEEQEAYTYNQCRVFMRSTERGDAAVNYMAQDPSRYLPVYPPGYVPPRRRGGSPPPRPLFSPPAPQESQEDESQDDDEEDDEEILEEQIEEEIIPVEGQAGPSQPKKRKLSYLGQSVLKAAIGSIGPTYDGQFKLAVKSAHFMPNQAGAEPPELVEPIDVSCSSPSPSAPVRGARGSQDLSGPSSSCTVITVKPVTRRSGKVRYSVANVASCSKQTKEDDDGDILSAGLHRGVLIADRDHEDENKQSEPGDKVADGDSDEDGQNEPLAESPNDDDEEEEDKQNQTVPKVANSDNDADNQNGPNAEVSNSDDDQDNMSEPIDEAANGDNDEDNDGEEGNEYDVINGNDEDGYSVASYVVEENRRFNGDPDTFFASFDPQAFEQFIRNMPKFPQCNEKEEYYNESRDDDEDEEDLDDDEEKDEELDEEIDEELDEEEEKDEELDEEIDEELDEEEEKDEELDEEIDEELDEELDEEEKVDDEEQLDGNNDQEEPNIDDQAHLDGNMDEEMNEEEDDDDEDYIVVDQLK